MSRLRAPLVLFLGVWLAANAFADPTRFAVVMGANRGMADEVQLRYAEQDAARVGKVLVQLAGVPEENLLLLQGSPPARVRAVMAEVAVRISRLRAEQPGVRPLLIVYYSGHSSAAGLHFGQTRMAFADLREVVQSAGADLALLVLDGCRSGGVTRAKGGRHVPGFTISAEPALQAKGTAIIASTADDEDALESDRLGGGIFTMHFIAGLRGAADVDADKRVTLSEAYAYAYRETLTATSRTRALQHPTFSFQLEGGQDVTLSRMDQAVGQATLRFQDPGRYVVLDRSQADGVVAELQLERPSDVLLPPGSYLIRHLGTRSAHEGRLELSEGGTATVNLATMTALPYGSAVRRGLSQDTVVSINADLAASMPMLSGFTTGIGAALGAAVDLPGVRLQGRMRYGRAEARNTDVVLTQQSVGGDVAALHVFDLPALRAGVGVGVRVGVDRFIQDFSTRGVAPERASWVWRAAPLLRLEYAPHPRWLAGAECGLDVHVMRVARGDSSGWESPVAPFCGLTGSFYLP